MNTNPLADLVSDQYSRWPYPAPITDIPGWLATNWEWFDPSHAHRLLWPNRDYNPDVDILIAGCGSNQAAVFAFTNPSAKVVAIDVSPAALEHHDFLKRKYEIKNLELHLLPMEQARGLGRDFDLIVSTGSLHHIADPRRGMAALAECLRPEGVVAIMVYAKYGRIGVETMQSVFHDLSLGQDDDSISTVKEAIASLPETHPARAYMGLARDLNSDAGWVDTYLHGREKSYSIDECIDLVGSAGLVFQDLFFKSPYHPPINSRSAFHSLVAALPQSKQWSIMERVNFSNACHFFTVCRSDRPPESYTADFRSSKTSDFVPSLRYRCRLDGNQIFRPGWSMTLDPASLALAQHIDGQRTIGQILEDVSQSGVFAPHSQEDRAKYARDLFQALWQLDFLAIKLP
jgi:SAM-dependent methyltransferase